MYLKKCLDNFWATAPTFLEKENYYNLLNELLVSELWFKCTQFDLVLVSEIRSVLETAQPNPILKC